MAPSSTIIPRFETIAADPACPFCSGFRQAIRIDVDQAYCISVAEEPERTAYATKHFHEIGLCRQVTFFRPPRGDSSRVELAIWQSHAAVAREALARGQRRVLIMEDDVSFRRPAAKVAPRVARAIAAIPSDWWGLYLGHMPIQSYFVARGVLRTRSTCLHAYIANRPLLEWLAKTEPMTAEVPMCLWIGCSVDAATANLPGMYALSPMAALQKRLGSYRVNSRLTWDGRRRPWRDADRWRNLFIFRGALVAEMAAVLASPVHRLTLERNIKRLEQGISRNARIVRESGLFDPDFYLQTYPDIANSHVNPLLHYLEFGAAEGRWPNPSFDPIKYAAQAAGLRRNENPLIHFIVTRQAAEHAQPPGSMSAG